jgi:hypothetical protein
VQHSLPVHLYWDGIFFRSIVSYVSSLVGSDIRWCSRRWLWSL